MDVELLVVSGCPHELGAVEMVSAVADELCLAVSVSTTVIETDEQARLRGFTGSPTILVSGHDLFPEAGAHVGMACRVYATPAGLSGLPSIEALRKALGDAAAS
ncbi:thioredoxin family protein [Nocardioides sp.]|uniref:DF family (seleno)protein n=1 Tax=Nocardioides sp. TaxID=35761 RepID=UPI00286AE5E3|nr:thioredoxin family protein [Nocardioides sp.]